MLVYVFPRESLMKTYFGLVYKYDSFESLIIWNINRFFVFYSDMENDKLHLLLDSYHNFCMELIKKIPVEHMPDDELIQIALRYRYKIEIHIMELEIKGKKEGQNYISKEIESLKKELENKKI